MQNKVIIILATLIIIMLAVWLFYFNNKSDPNTMTNDNETMTELDKFGLSTNTDKRSIDLDLVLSGGPGKDGIPALNYPSFIDLKNTEIDDDIRGIFIEHNGEKKYYPYSILVWHEIINDNVGGKELAITFCPLCGTGIVFNRNVDNELLDFGVSGLLFESNLLMYDKKTESLWSQARGEAVIGEYTGTKLNIFSMQLISVKELKSKHPDSKVLSTNTGYLRDYTSSPYAGYKDTETTYFPISVEDNRFPAKELMYVVPYSSMSLAIQYSEILKNKTLIKQIEGGQLIINTDGEEIIAKINDKVLPTYFEMWFSWATHHQEDGTVLN